MSSFCVIGSGISGATIANLLNKKHTVDLYDKARGLGGRSSFKRLDNQRGFDHGTQYFSPKTTEFKRFTKKLIEKKILKIWGGNHKFLSDKKKENKKHVKVIGRKGNNDISKYLLKNVRCYFQSELKKINFQNRKWNLTFNDGEMKNYENLILTCPFPQLKKLSKKYIKNSFINENIKMDANITILIEIKKTNLGYSSFLFNDRILGWAGYENSKKRFKSKSDLWTLQSTFNWANKKINQNKVLKKTNAKILIDKFFKLTGIKRTKILFSLNHGWKYSSNSKPLKLKSYWNSRLNLGVCADWFNGPRLESGWISANDLYKKINS
ncbi:NAD(P)-binding protein [Pelagibacterales bacterium SAG-MED35]|jgi:predicted NAD/FAD-dependent oxidoreductase|nr:NAD(P)-binding protein [Pelagibacterales bacterium SAG-MED35]